MTVNFRQAGKTQNVTPPAANTPTLVPLSADCTAVDALRIYNQTSNVVWIAFRASGASAPSTSDMLEGYPLGPNSIETVAKNEGVPSMYVLVESAASGRVSLTPGRGA